MMRFAALMAATAFAVSGCASPSDTVSQRLSDMEAGDGSVLRIGDDGFRLSALAPRRLSPGECGLFLWSVSRTPELVFFSADDERGAVVNIGGEETGFRRVSFDGAPVLRQYATQQFRNDERGLTLTVTVEAGRSLVNGVATPTGSLEFVQDDGWELVTPVGGMAGCQTTE